MLPVFRILAKLKGLRGTPLDIFGYTAERRSERAQIAEYEALVDEVLTRLSADNHAVAVELARLPQEIRGFGHIRAASLAAAKTRWSSLLSRLRGQSTAQVIRMPQKRPSGLPTVAAAAATSSFAVAHAGEVAPRSSGGGRDAMRCNDQLPQQRWHQAERLTALAREARVC
jgi:hypothetical protein